MPIKKFKNAIRCLELDISASIYEVPAKYHSLIHTCTHTHTCVYAHIGMVYFYMICINGMCLYLLCI